MTDIFHNPSLAEADSAQAYMAEQWKPERTRERYDWLFSYDATTAAV
jgi:salicylate hydroxylase